MIFRNYSEAQFREACKTSFSKRQTLIKLGIKAEGGNYATLARLIKQLSIDISHFTGKGWRKGKTFIPKRLLQDYLLNKYTIQSSKLRIRLLKEGIFEYRCIKCKNTTWNELPIPLELDHKDGNNTNNKLINIQLICPNCHAQTLNYRGKNIGSSFSSALPPPEDSPN